MDGSPSCAVSYMSMRISLGFLASIHTSVKHLSLPLAILRSMTMLNEKDPVFDASKTKQSDGSRCKNDKET